MATNLPYSQACENNQAPILEKLREIFNTSGKVLETTSDSIRIYTPNPSGAPVSLRLQLLSIYPNENRIGGHCKNITCPDLADHPAFSAHFALYSSFEGQLHAHRGRLQICQSQFAGNTINTRQSARLTALGPVVIGHRSPVGVRSEEHTSELQSRPHLVC